MPEEKMQRMPEFQDAVVQFRRSPSTSGQKGKLICRAFAINIVAFRPLFGAFTTP
jgi:hypothetical protein